MAAIFNLAILGLVVAYQASHGAPEPTIGWAAGYLLASIFTCALLAFGSAVAVLVYRTYLPTTVRKTTVSFLALAAIASLASGIACGLAEWSYTEALAAILRLAVPSAIFAWFYIRWERHEA